VGDPDHSTEADGASAPRVSVVLPTCNRRDITVRCLDALGVQDHDAYEVIVIDDGSTDGTPDTLSKYAEDHPGLGLRVLVNGANRGANVSRNRGIDAARGRIIAFLDSDCIAEPDWLTNLERGFTHDLVAGVTGLVTDPEPRNRYDLAFRGTHRVVTPGRAPRLVAGNMALRADILCRFAFDVGFTANALNPDGTPDLSVSGRSDEAGLAIKLRAAGYELRSVPGAVVYHEHFYTRRSFFRQGWRGGRSAARLVRRFGLPPRIDVWPLLAAWITLPIAMGAGIATLSTGGSAWWWATLALPASFFALAFAAYGYNELARKGKTPGELARCWWLVLAYYHTRAAGYAWQSLRLALGIDTQERFDLDAVRGMARAQT